ncbi:hypothetical protein CROQUDRAFT_10767, partial [Cronartium quercuum f. sp. fusiforme G11]
LWAEIALATVFTLNKSPHAFLDHELPVARWNSLVPGGGMHESDAYFLQTLGFSAVFLAPRHIGKLSMKVRDGVLVGYESGAKAYCIWDIESHEIVVTCAVNLNEALFPFS